MDFTPATYTRLLEALQASGYSFQTIAAFFESAEYKTVLLRHDVDLLPRNALAMAKLEHGLGVGATYYSRAAPESWDESLRDGGMDESLREGWVGWMDDLDA
jgi:hypothetical protein